MGVYDTVITELFCPFCGTKNNDFQTKDLGCFMSTWTISEIKRFCNFYDRICIYTHCVKCKKWIELIIKGESDGKNLL